MSASRFVDPERFIADFLTTFSREVVRSDEDLAKIVDRYHTPDVVQIADGIRLDREKLIAHAAPIRQRRPDTRVEVHEALEDDGRIAARYTLSVLDSRRELAIEVSFFGQFAPDGRLQRAHLLTRPLPAKGEATAEPKTTSTPQEVAP